MSAFLSDTQSIPFGQFQFQIEFIDSHSNLIFYLLRSLRVPTPRKMIVMYDDDDDDDI